MDRRKALLLVASLPLAVTLPAKACVLEDRGMLKDVPVITVDELAAGLRKEGFQSRYLAHQIRFDCTCVPFKGALDEAALPYCLIDGLEKSPMPKARLHNGKVKYKEGMRLSVHGLIVQEDYGIWPIWVYAITYLT